jgi:5-formyltetrahydrofolate cyclo-ligase
VAYDGQRVERVPRDPTDARLDAILTECRVLIVET